MKTLSIRFAAFLAWAALAVSCEDFLDPKVDNSYGDEITWTLPGYAQGVLLNAYSNIIQVNPAYNSTNYLDVIADNAVTNDFSSSLYRFVSGGQSATSEPFSDWGTAYNQFRNIHLFLEKGLGPNIKYDLFDDKIDDALRKRLEGEAYFLRAWWGMYLLQIYGGVTDDGQSLGYPIVLLSFTEADRESANSMPRNTYAECVAQIVADCEQGRRLLPLKYTGNDGVVGASQIGRGDGRTCLAIRSRAALYEASPAYRAARLTQTQVDVLWERAAMYARKAIDTASMGGYAPLLNASIVGAGAEKTYGDELLLMKWWYNPTQESNNFPPMFFGQGKTNPSQNLINAYPTRSGYPITRTESGYSAQNPYDNRDNRMAQTVWRNGENFNSERALEIYVTADGHPGRDAADGAEYRNTRTGYYLKRGMSTVMNFLYNPTTLGTSNDYHQRGLIRRAEMWLNLAEAMNQRYGPKGTGSTTDQWGNAIPLATTAYSIIKGIRWANGVGASATSDPYLDEVAAQGKDAFHALIMNERRLEFAFENHRFFDMRRWLMPLDVDILGVKIVKDGATLTFSGTNPGVDDIVVERRSSLQGERYFYTPIPYNEMAKNPNLKQNKGWK